MNQLYEKCNYFTQLAFKLDYRFRTIGHIFNKASIYYSWNIAMGILKSIKKTVSSFKLRTKLHRNQIQ